MAFFIVCLFPLLLVILGSALASSALSSLSSSSAFSTAGNAVVEGRTEKGETALDAVDVETTGTRETTIAEVMGGKLSSLTSLLFVGHCLAKI